MIKALRKSKAGFTMIELLVVIAIIGILSAIAIPQYTQYREKAYIASMKADCVTVRTGEEAYFVDNNTYAVVASTTDPSGALPGTSALSSGNTVVVTAGTSIGVDYVITISDTIIGRTGKTVTYTSSTGVMTVI